MRSKNVTAIIALLFASTGAHRFFIGQNKNGWLFLLFFYVAFPAFIFYSKTYHVVNHYMLTTIWIALIGLTHITESIRFAIMQSSVFEKQDQSTGATLPLTFSAVLFGVAATYGFNYLMQQADVINIETAKPEFAITSIQLSAAYNANEENYMEMFDGKVLQVAGTVNSFGEDFENGTYLALRAADGSPADVNCFINENYLPQLSGIAAGDSVVIKGVCNRRFLDNCKIISVHKK